MCEEMDDMESFTPSGQTGTRMPSERQFGSHLPKRSVTSEGRGQTLDSMMKDWDREDMLRHVSQFPSYVRKSAIQHWNKHHSFVGTIFESLEIYQREAEKNHLPKK